MTIIMSVTLDLMAHIDPQSLTSLRGVLKTTQTGVNYLIVKEDEKNTSESTTQNLS